MPTRRESTPFVTRSVPHRPASTDLLVGWMWDEGRHNRWSRAGAATITPLAWAFSGGGGATTFQPGPSGIRFPAPVCADVAISFHRPGQSNVCTSTWATLRGVVSGSASMGLSQGQTSFLGCHRRVKHLPQQRGAQHLATAECQKTGAASASDYRDADSFPDESRKLRIASRTVCATDRSWVSA